LKINYKGFTLIELLVVVAIIGILAAVGVVAYNGYTASAKKSAATANHKNVVKYIINEVMKCSTGASEAMDGKLDCTKQGLNNWKDYVAKAVEKSLSELKNPYDTSESAVTHGGGITSDVHVGYNRMLSPGLKIQVMTCVKTPCSGTKCEIPNHVCSGDIILD
jgi:type IV pilus assembly protein PilA|tara:strand:+ start:837 stop:1325 length:489 start_codon:yes stop_codon:yes gene_type:complete